MPTQTLEKSSIDVEAALDRDSVTRTLYRLARDLAGAHADENLVDDLVQEGRYGFWKRSNAFDPSRASLNSFVYVCATSAMLDELRRRTAQRRRFVSIEDEHLDAHGAAGEEMNDDRDVEELAEQVIAEPKRFLTCRQAEVVEALQRYGSAAEAGIALGLTPDAFKCALCRARRRLKELVV